MRSKLLMLLFSCLFLLIVNAGSVIASDSYVWEIAPTDATASITNKITTSWTDTNSLYLTNVGYTQTLLLVDGTKLTPDVPKAVDFTIYKVDDNYRVINLDNDLVIDLGTESKFQFVFSDNNGSDLVYNYSYNFDGFKGDAGYQYTLSADSIGATAVLSFGVNPTVSAVPIPGTALLLGSSLLGLVGIGSRRRKKA